MRDASAEPDLVADVDCLVVGGGVIGLAITRALASAGRETLLVEQENRFGTGTSARNSGVIHSGIYYPKDSMKARLCVRGRNLLYAYAKARGVPHHRCGKLIVATADDEIGTLESLKARAEDNDVADLEWLDHNRVAQLEPEISARKALLSPSTGIIDVPALIDALAVDATDAGAILAPGSRMLSARREGGHFLVRILSGDEALVRCRFLVNAAGLFAPAVARTIEGIRADRLPTAYFARGNYFAYSGPARFRHLVYPVPERGGLGIHLTLDMAGAARFGPDVEWVDSIDYRVDESRKQAFVASIRRYWPSIDPDRLKQDYSGIRPKIAPADITTDFVIQTAGEHGVEGLVNLLGIESPGLTSSLAIAEHVLELVDT